MKESPLFALRTPFGGDALLPEEEARAQVQLVEVLRVELELKKRQLDEANVTLRNLLRVMHAERELLRQETCDALFRQVGPLLDALEARQLDSDPLFAEHVAALRCLEPKGLRAATLNSRLTELTPMEMRVCKLVQQGMSNKAIAELLAITLETVKTHRRSIRRKLGLSGQKKHLYKQLAGIGLQN